MSHAKSVSDAKEKLPSFFLIHGDDDFLVEEEARSIIARLIPKGASEFALETIDGTAVNQDEATATFKKLFESLQSSSFFASEKVVWWRNTNLLGSNAMVSSSVVSDSLAELNQFLQERLPPRISLVITATDFDGRKSITKTFAKIGRVIAFKTDPYKEQQNQSQALDFAQETAAKLGKKLEMSAGVLLVEMSGRDCRTIRSELEKVATYVGTEATIREKEVREIGSWRPGGVVWDLPDAIGERDLGKAWVVLDHLLFLGEAPIVLLFAIISRVRLLLLLCVLVEEKLLRVDEDYASFKSQLERLPSWILENLPRDKKLNPLANHPFVLYKAAPGVSCYTRVELQQALETLLKCNERLVSSGGRPKSIMEDALLKICMKQ